MKCINCGKDRGGRSSKFCNRQECIKERAVKRTLEWRKLNRGKYKAQWQKRIVDISKYNKKRNAENKLLVVKHYSNGKMRCACCGESHIEFLAIDHVNNNGASHRKVDNSAKNLPYWLIKNGYPDGFQILCHNCNWAKYQHKICPHQLNK